MVYIWKYRYTDDSLKDAIKYLLNNEIIEKFNIKTDNIHYYTEDVYIGYENCPVGTEYIGMVGYVNDKFVYIKPTERKYKDSGAPDEQIYCCYIIPSEYKEAFEIFPHFSHYNAEVAKNSREAKPVVSK